MICRRLSADFKLNPYLLCADFSLDPYPYLLCTNFSLDLYLLCAEFNFQSWSLFTVCRISVVMQTSRGSAWPIYSRISRLSRVFLVLRF